MKQQSCPVCEERVRAERNGADDETIRELRSARRVLVWLIDRKQEDQGPLIWAMPQTLDNQIWKVSRDRSTGKWYVPEDPISGYDVYFDRDGDGLGTKYTGVQLARNSSRVDQRWIDFVAGEQDERSGRWIIQPNPLPETLRWRDYAEVKRLFEGGDNLGDSGDKPGEERAPVASREPNPESEPNLESAPGTVSEPPNPASEPHHTSAPPVAREPESTSTNGHDDPPDNPPWEDAAPPPAPPAAGGSTRAAALRERLMKQG